jgi:hypothetical protein
MNYLRARRMLLPLLLVAAITVSAAELRKKKRSS